MDLSQVNEYYLTNPNKSIVNSKGFLNSVILNRENKGYRNEFIVHYLIKEFYKVKSYGVIPHSKLDKQGVDLIFCFKTKECCLIQVKSSIPQGRVRSSLEKKDLFKQNKLSLISWSQSPKVKRFLFKNIRTYFEERGVTKSKIHRHLEKRTGNFSYVPLNLTSKEKKYLRLIGVYENYSN